MSTALPAVPAAIAAALVAESAPARADFRARVALVAAAGRELRRLPRSSGRQPTAGAPRPTFGSICASARLSKKRARTWQDVADAEPRLDDYLEDARLGDRELSLAGLVRFAKPAAPRPDCASHDVLWSQFLVELGERIGVLVEALEADPTGASLGLGDVRTAAADLRETVELLQDALENAAHEAEESEEDDRPALLPEPTP